MIIDDIEAFVFDFDGVLTNNLVHINETGKESVVCSRADGLAFDVLHKIKKPVYLLSTEKSQVVEKRAKKIKTPVMYGVGDKVLALREIARTNNYNLDNILYVGNDLNDYLAMKICGYRACPIDSHQRIKEISGIIFKTKGGNGVVRELLEEHLKLDFIEILYSKKEV